MLFSGMFSFCLLKCLSVSFRVTDLDKVSLLSADVVSGFLEVASHVQTCGGRASDLLNCGIGTMELLCSYVSTILDRVVTVGWPYSLVC